MRPRVFPAENGLPAAFPDVNRHASMRPRVFPAENLGAATAMHTFLTLQ